MDLEDQLLALLWRIRDQLCPQIVPMQGVYSDYKKTVKGQKLTHISFQFYFLPTKRNIAGLELNFHYSKSKARM